MRQTIQHVLRDRIQVLRERLASDTAGLTHHTGMVTKLVRITQEYREEIAEIEALLPPEKLTVVA